MGGRPAAAGQLRPKPDPHGTQHRAVVRPAGRGGPCPRHAKYFFKYPEGDKPWFEFIIQPVPEGIFILSLDITTRRDSGQAIRQLNLELEQHVAERTAQWRPADHELGAFT